MATIKITELNSMVLPANTQQCILVGVDTSGSNPVTRKFTLSNLSNTINQTAEAILALETANNASNTAAEALGTVSSAYDQANTASSSAEYFGHHANASFDIANTALSVAQSSNANSLIVVLTGPTTPLGNTGDESGMVYMTNVAFYYCTSNYDGVTNVWSKITSTDAW